MKKQRLSVSINIDQCVLLSISIDYYRLPLAAAMVMPLIKAIITEADVFEVAVIFVRFEPNLHCVSRSL
jgi:hypothetical protein